MQWTVVREQPSAKTNCRVLHRKEQRCILVLPTIFGMRHNPKDLDELVQAMNSEELRACHGQLKHYASKYSSALAVLLHAIRDEESAQQQKQRMTKLGHDGKLKHLRRILTEQIDLALMIHYRHLTGATRLRAMHLKVEILLGKRLMRQAELVVNEMLDLSRSLHDLEAERSTLKQQLILMVDGGREHLEAHLPAWRSRMEEITRQMHAEDELRVIVKQLFALRREKGNDLSDADREWVQVLVGHPLLQTPPHTLGLHGQRQYHLAYLNYHKLMLQMDQALEHHLRMRALWDANPALKHDRPDHYRWMLDDVFGIYFRTGRYADAAAIHEAMRETLLWSHEQNVDHAVKLCINGMLVHLNQANRQGMLHELQQTSILIDEYGSCMVPSAHKTLCYNAAVCCFLLQHDRAALRWLAILLHRHGGGVRKDLDAQAANLQLMLWFDRCETDKLTERLATMDVTAAGTNAISMLLHSVLLQNVDGGKHRMSNGRWQQVAHQLQAVPQGNSLIGYEEMNVWVQAHVQQLPRWQVFAQNTMRAKVA